MLQKEKEKYMGWGRRENAYILIQYTAQCSLHEALALFINDLKIYTA